MNVKYILTWSLMCLLFATSCAKEEIFLTGNIDGFYEETIYLSEIRNEQYSRFVVVDSAHVEDGRFKFDLKNKSAQLYFIGNGGVGGKVFVEPTGMQITGIVTATQAIKWNVSGSLLHNLYHKFIEEKNTISYQHEKDSLDELFYIARDKDNRDEMSRIKNECAIYYSDKVYQRVDSFVNSQIKANMDNVFGIYLYKSKMFLRFQAKTIEDVAKCREYISDFSGEAITTNYFKYISQKLDVFEKCAIGAIAPEITGKDTLGNTTKLSDYRGKYVIVDFWSSGCKYCRLESPNLQKAMDMYGDKNFTILGVSSDRKKDLWLKAIHEDETYWNHLKIEKDDISAIMNSYCINGIPHIILVDPQGKIVAKDLRGKDIYAIPGKFIN